MVAMFGSAFKQQPENKELGAQTFFANVRTGHWKEAQQVSCAPLPADLLLVFYKPIIFAVIISSFCVEISFLA
jgi:hypothetical protein